MESITTDEYATITEINDTIWNNFNNIRENMAQEMYKMKLADNEIVLKQYLNFSNILNENTTHKAWEYIRNNKDDQFIEQMINNADPIAIVIQPTPLEVKYEFFNHSRVIGEFTPNPCTITSINTKHVNPVEYQDKTYNESQMQPIQCPELVLIDRTTYKYIGNLCESEVNFDYQKNTEIAIILFVDVYKYPDQASNNVIYS